MDHKRIYEFLMSGECVSGEWIGSQLGATHEAVRNAVEALRAQGHDIQSSGEQGYRLIPPKDALWPSCIQKELHTRWAGNRIEYHQVIDSTNFRARALGLEDAPHGTLVVADEQTAGRGRMARSWESRAGDSILMSLLLRPENLPPMNATGIVLIAALAACTACRAEGADVRIKWPNDLIAGGKKLCGMLLDMNADVNQVNFAVVGVGINVRSFPYADDLKHATCLMDVCGREISRARVTAAFLMHFESLYETWSKGGMPAILPMYRELSITLGSRVRVIGLQEAFEALAVDVLDDGALLVQKDSGERVPVRAGDVSVRGVMDYA